MEFEFSKMHGLGNDYVYVNCYKEQIDKPSQLAQIVSDRHFGIGSDGLILICPSHVADCKMCMYNADGTEGAMCGNGIRCVGKYVYDHRIAQKNQISVETASGIKKLHLIVEDKKVNSITVNMGKPDFKAANIPVRTKRQELIGVNIRIETNVYKATCVSMGNPHIVVFADNISSLDISSIGSMIENHKRFPDRTNVEFVNVIDDKSMEMRVWERGSGETLACGTGACATVASAIAMGYCERNQWIRVKLLGGELYIKQLNSGNILMKGPAVTSFTGTYNIE